MPPDTAVTAYFDTPARAERLQLLLYLARNAPGPVYLRGPDGAGKSRFIERLRTQLDDDQAVVRIDLAEPVKLVAAIIQQLGLPPEAADDWPSGLTRLLHDRQCLLIVDNADAIDAGMRAGLASLGEAGVRLLLVGRGKGIGDWAVQFVDLPAFEPEQSAAFLRVKAGTQAARITDDLAAASHAAANGLPGPLLEVLQGLPHSDAPAQIVGKAPDPRQRPSAGATGKPPKASAVAQRLRAKRSNPWPWLGAGALAVVLVAVLLSQDRINALLTAPPETEQLPAERASPTDVTTLALPSIPTPVSEPAPKPETEAETVRTAGDLEPAPAADPAPAEIDAGGGPAVTDNVPEIALPELSRPVAGGAPVGAEPGEKDAVASLMPPLDDIDADLESSAATVDPLDAVLQDAQNAANQPAETPRAADAAQAGVDGLAVAPTAPLPPTPASPAAAAAEQTAAARPDVPSAAVVAEPPSAGAPVVDAGTIAVARDRQTTVQAPAPVEDRSSVETAVGKGRGDRPADSAAPAVAQGGDAWLRSRPAQHFTLQLVAASERASIEKFVEIHGISPPFAIFRRELNGKDWYSLLAGDYPDRAAAIAARERLPQALKGSGVWPRTFASVQPAR